MIAATYGPAEVRSSKELIDKATLEVVFRPKVGVSGILYKELYVKLNTCKVYKMCGGTIGNKIFLRRIFLSYLSPFPPPHP